MSYLLVILNLAGKHIADLDAALAERTEQYQLAVAENERLRSELASRTREGAPHGV